jgi:hypothetical protein
MAPDFRYVAGQLITQDVGQLGQGSVWATWLRGSWRLGTPFNDIARRNIGSGGVIFDPALPPLQELLYAGLIGGVGGPAVAWLSYESHRFFRAWVAS